MIRAAVIILAVLLAALPASAQFGPGCGSGLGPCGGGVSAPPTTAPSNITPPSILGPPQVGQTLMALVGGWAGSPTGFAFQWLSGGSPISGATATTYVPVTGDIGATITVRVTATNAIGSTASTSSGVGPVTAAPVPPTNTVLPVISGTPQVGQTLTASNGTWTGSPTSFTDLWSNGATGSTYVPVTGDIGAHLSVVVTATNAAGSTPATSASVGPVTASGGGAPSLRFNIASNSQYIGVVH